MYRLNTCATEEVIGCYFTMAGCFSKSRNMEICRGGSCSVSRVWELEGSWFKSQLRTTVGKGGDSIAEVYLSKVWTPYAQTGHWDEPVTRLGFYPAFAEMQLGINPRLKHPPHKGTTVVVFLTVSFHIPSVFFNKKKKGIFYPLGVTQTCKYNITGKHCDIQCPQSMISGMWWTFRFVFLPAAHLSKHSRHTQLPPISYTHVLDLVYVQLSILIPCNSDNTIARVTDWVEI